VKPYDIDKMRKKGLKARHVKDKLEFNKCKFVSPFQVFVRYWLIFTGLRCAPAWANTFRSFRAFPKRAECPSCRSTGWNKL